MHEPALILLAHGARDAEWARPLERLREAIVAQDPQRDARLAFLEFMMPNLADAIDQAVAAGIRRIAVVPVFLAQGGHVKRDVPTMLADARRRHPQVSIELRPVLGESQIVIDAMAACALKDM
ncbi:MAG TPA: CbiX/SirB N-terminal domain-containing protein [Rhodocyclaceae bacterium]|nr:CbiX/SirB N-terminal domain-containing protein [Rhodocyclaceae bacterium]